MIHSLVDDGYRDMGHYNQLQNYRHGKSCLPKAKHVNGRKQILVILACDATRFCSEAFLLAMLYHTT